MKFWNFWIFFGFFVDVWVYWCINNYQIISWQVFVPLKAHKWYDGAANMSKQAEVMPTERK